MPRPDAERQLRLDRERYARDPEFRERKARHRNSLAGVAQHQRHEDKRALSRLEQQVREGASFA